MITIISPAKNLDFSESSPELNSQPELHELSQELMTTLKKMKPTDLESLMKISSKIADLNYERNQQWNYPFDNSKSKAAALAFNGEVYTGLDFSSFNSEEATYAQNHLRILSGLYGVLKPFDQILPYRLEMGTKLKTPKFKNLYEFWDDVILNHLNQLLETENAQYLVNLASTEYSKAAKLKNINKPIITPNFKDNKNGTYKVIMMYAKKARGQMAAYILKNKITTLDELKAYDEGGYVYNESLSSNLDLVFTRG